MREAFQIAAGGRPGPVLIDITKDAQQTACDFDWDAAAPKPARPAGARRQSAIAREGGRADQLGAAAGHPRRPRHHPVECLDGACGSLPSARKIPIAMTLLGIGGIPASHPLNLGMMGMHGEAWVNTAIQEADLLLAFGMRFDDRVTGNLKTYAPNATQDPHRHRSGRDRQERRRRRRDRRRPSRRGRKPPRRQSPPASGAPWLPAYRRDEGGRGCPRHQEPAGRRASVCGARHQRHLAGDRRAAPIVVTDVGQHQMWEAQYYHHDEPRSLITSGGLGTMGFALPAAIGAKMACPDKEVWVIAGDGGFQMTMPELATIAQENLDIKIAIINNGYLGMVRQWQEFFYERRYAATPLLSPDFVEARRRLRPAGGGVTRRSEVDPAIAGGAPSQQHGVLDFRVEQEDTVYPMVPAGADLHAMIRRPSRSSKPRRTRE